MRTGNGHKFYTWFLIQCIQATNTAIEVAAVSLSKWFYQVQQKERPVLSLHAMPYAGNKTTWDFGWLGLEYLMQMLKKTHGKINIIFSMERKLI